MASRNGCEGTGRLAVTGTILPMPTIASTGPNGSSVTMGQSVTLGTTTGYTTYQWKNAGGSVVGSSPTYTTSTLGNYTVTVTLSGATNSGVSQPHSVSSGISGLNRNYMIANTLLIGSVTDPNAIAGLTVDQYSQSVQYVDGLGRPVQTVTTQGSPAKKDMVQPVTYDELGREAKKYLPYVGTGTSGWIKDNALTAQLQFYGSSPKVSADAAPFSVTVFEPSPLNRTLEQGSPGTAWQPNTDNSYTSTDRTTKKNYALNSPNEVLLWTYTSPDASFPFGKVAAGSAAAPVYFEANKLTKNKSKDEQHNEIIEYVDKAGRTVLKRVQATGSQTVNDSDYASTYYIYDNLGNLVCVVPPAATTMLATNYFQAGSTDATKDAFLKLWAFRYTYDNRRRMTMKQVPGAEPVYMVYDLRDRLILTQDGNQRAGAPKYWSFTKYDQLNRPILTGIRDTTASLSQAQMQNVVNIFFAPNTRWSETYVGSATGNVHGYSNKAYPVRTGSTAGEVNINKYNTVTYYDDYAFRSLWTGTWDYFNENLSESSGGVSYPQPSAAFGLVVGQVTGTKVKVLDGGVTSAFTWLNSISYYDENYRVIQTLSDNYKGGTDRITNVLDFSGKVLKTKATHLEQDVTWKELVGTTVVGNKLERTLTGSSWAAGAVSTTQLAAGQNGWLEMKVTDVTGNKMIGLADTNPDANYTSIDYCFYLNGNTLRVYENGVLKATVSGTLVAGDVIRIDRTGTTVTYKKNGTTVYTSATASSTLLMADVSINAVNLTLAGVRASFGSSTRTSYRRFEYDHAGRLLQVRHQLEGSSEIRLIKNEYNELGQLVDKKLHSADNGSTWKQSVDYRYNIRGWLETINNSKLEGNVPSNDDTGDLFGMELKYNAVDTDLGNAALFNGNISGVKWSNYPGTGTIKEKGYTYGYDPLNRITSSAYREKAPTWTALDNNRFAETGFTYDLNGNILTLTRNDGRPTVDGKMDILAYDYTGSGNQLLKVTDGGDDFKGFVDGVNTGNDYTYDANGNMTRDLNKGIGNSLTDNINIITYNFLNLPETVTKGGNSVRYVYDATGRKLSQGVTFAGAVKQTDYAGEYIYENDALQFINHEEGRISIASNALVYTNPGEATTDFIAVNATLAQVTLNGAEKYVRATSNGTTARTGIFPIGGTFPVSAGDKYRIRVKGYRTGSNPVYIQAKINGTDVIWPGAAIASNVASESWTEQTVVIPPAATNMTVGVNWNTVTANEIFYLNEIEITKLSTTALPEYQYHLKDHLGNVRTTFTSKVSIELPRATVETDSLAKEQTKFLNITRARRVNGRIFDHTHNGVSPPNGAYSTRLTGSTNEKIGLAQSLSVMPGDKIDVEVFAKYIDPGSTNDNALIAVLAAIASGGSVPAGTFLDGAGYATASSATYPFTGNLNYNDAGTAPKAYLNYVVFDKNFLFKTGGFKRISTAARETGDLVNHTGLNYEGAAHERLAFEGATQIAITEPGYVYVWLSNEETTPVEVYFDDFRVTHTKSPVIQADDYYPFGLTFNSYSRENSTQNRYLYNQGAGERKFNTERVADLDLNVDQSRYRTYDFATGRWWQVDPKADSERQESWSPYQFGFNNPILYNDPEGDVIPVVVGLYYLGVAAVATVGAAVIYYQGKKTIESTTQVIKTSIENSSRSNQLNSEERVKEKALEDLNPIHSPESTEKTKSGQDIGKLSNEELLDAANNPQNGDLIKENTKTGGLQDGNTRVNELKKRAADPKNKDITPKTKVKVQEQTPDDSDLDFVKQN